MRHTIYLARPELRHPVLVVAFEGWNDAGEAASSALDFICGALDSEPFARIDPEEFYDFQQTRPTVQRKGAGREIDWPSVNFHSVRVPGGSRDLVALRGSEPNLRWRTFTEEIFELAGTVGVELVVTVGALLADVPHTRPVQVVGSSTDPVISSRLGLSPSRYEGPTGIIGVIGDAASSLEIPSVSVWAALPHYVQASPNPRATQALVAKLSELLNLDVDTSPLSEAAHTYDETVAEMVSEDPDLVTYVERLERQSDEEDESDDDDDQPSLGDVPAEQFVADVERFLREQRGNRP